MQDLRAEPARSGLNLWRNNTLYVVTGTRAFSADRMKTQRTAVRLGRLGVSCQIVVEFAGKALAHSMNFRDDRVVPNNGFSHDAISISSNGVTSSGKVKPLAAHKPRITGSCAGLAMWVQFHANRISIS